MQKNKKILVIAAYFPYPLYSGARIRSYYNAKILKKYYDLDFLCIIEEKIKKDYIKELKKVFNKIFIFTFPSIRFKFNALKGLFSQKPLQVHYFYFKEVQKWIDENFKKYDLIYCNYIRTAEYVKNLKIPKIIDFHDAISRHYRNAIKDAQGFWRLIYFIENGRLLNYELETLKKFDLAFINTQADKEFILKHYSGKDRDIIVLPMGVKNELLKRKFKGKEKNWLSFIGKLDYIPNEDAVLYFAKNVFPYIRKKNKNIKFYIIGANPTKEILELRKEPGIKITGFVEDPYWFLERSKLIVAPIRRGAGIQNKVLEGMVLGKAVIVTPLSASGIPQAKNNQHLVIIDPTRPLEMAKKIVELLNNEKERLRIGGNAKKLILKYYTWERNGQMWLKNIKKILESKA